MPLVVRGEVPRAEGAAERRPVATQRADLPLQRLARPELGEPAGDPFETMASASDSVIVEPAAPPAAVELSPGIEPEPEPAMRAPGFVALGRWHSGETVSAFIAVPDESRTVQAAPGDTLPGGFRVAKVGDDAVELVHGTSGARLVLGFGAAADVQKDAP